LSEKKIYRCLWCNKIIVTDPEARTFNAYISKSKTQYEGKMCWCKECVNNQYLKYHYDFKDIRRAIFSNCRQFNIPFLENKFDMAMTQLKDMDNKIEKAFGTYMQKVYSGNVDNKIASFDDGTTNIDILYKNVDGIVEQSVEDKWGAGYQPEEYEAFEKKYKMLKNNYPEKTSLHTEALLNYIRYRCKEELATAKGDVKEAKEWSTMAAKAATDAKINPSQLSAADLQGGLNSFSEITKIAEEDSDIIKKLPQFMYRPNDSADFILWCIINYMRKSKGQEEVDYHDIYAFYDRKKDEYIEQYGDPYGIFVDDPTIDNRDKIDKFIKTSYSDGGKNG
jgi:hypothetical protein